MESGDKRECCCSAAFIIVFIMVLKWGWDLDFISMIFAGLLYLMIATPVLVLFNNKFNRNSENNYSKPIEKSNLQDKSEHHNSYLTKKNNEKYVFDNVYDKISRNPLIKNQDDAINELFLIVNNSENDNYFSNLLSSRGLSVYDGGRIVNSLINHIKSQSGISSKQNVNSASKSKSISSQSKKSNSVSKSKSISPQYKKNNEKYVFDNVYDKISRNPLIKNQDDAINELFLIVNNSENDNYFSNLLSSRGLSVYDGGRIVNSLINHIKSQSGISSKQNVNSTSKSKSISPQYKKNNIDKVFNELYVSIQGNSGVHTRSDAFSALYKLVGSSRRNVYFNNLLNRYGLNSYEGSNIINSLKNQIDLDYPILHSSPVKKKNPVSSSKNSVVKSANSNDYSGNQSLKISKVFNELYVSIQGNSGVHTRSDAFSALYKLVGSSRRNVYFNNLLNRYGLNSYEGSNIINSLKNQIDLDYPILHSSPVKKKNPVSSSKNSVVKSANSNNYSRNKSLKINDVVNELYKNIHGSSGVHTRSDAYSELNKLVGIPQRSFYFKNLLNKYNLNTSEGEKIINSLRKKIELNYPQSNNSSTIKKKPFRNVSSKSKNISLKDRKINMDKAFDILYNQIFNNSNVHTISDANNELNNLVGFSRKTVYFNNLLNKYALSYSDGNELIESIKIKIISDYPHNYHEPNTNYTKKQNVNDYHLNNENIVNSPFTIETEKPKKSVKQTNINTVSQEIYDQIPYQVSKKDALNELDRIVNTPYFNNLLSKYNLNFIDGTIITNSLKEKIELNFKEINKPIYKTPPKNDIHDFNNVSSLLKSLYNRNLLTYKEFQEAENIGGVIKLHMSIKKDISSESLTAKEIKSLIASERNKKHNKFKESYKYS